MKEKGMRYKFLYTNGDSFSAGAGLANRIFLSEHPTFCKELTKKEVQRNKISSDYMNQFHLLLKSKSVNYKEFIEVEKSLAFHSTVCKKLGIEGKNDSVHGGSFTHIYFTTIESLTEIMKTVPAKDIFVVILLTGIYRLLIPDSNTDQYKNLNPMVFAFENFLTDEETAIAKYMFQYADDNYYVMMAKMAIEGLIYFFQSNNINYTFLDSHIYEGSKMRLPDNLKNYLPSFGDTLFSRYSGDDVKFLPCGHFNQSAHDDIANLIIENYLK